MSAAPQKHAEPQAERTRLAPSPTGALHLGNARTFLVNWALARQRGWEIVLRVEDLDTPRVKPGAIEESIEILQWLGMDWDEGPVVQSEDLAPYRQAMRALAGQRRVYPCSLTRGQIEAASSAPQEGVQESRFATELRPDKVPAVFDHEDTNWRLMTEDVAVCFEDGFHGRVSVNPGQEVGDFVIWTRRGQPSYQLAVVVDDFRQGVTQVVRGDDLVSSAGRQMLLYEALGYGDGPSQTHLPLVRGSDGRRLAKRHGDTRLRSYRQAGVRRERVVGLVAYWCGMTDDRTEMSAAAFCLGFELDKIPRGDIVFTREDEQWLLVGT
jgi:glutamyl-tRNA synthetase